MEVWTDIKGYEGMYQISDLGNVKSFNMYNWGKVGLLKPCKNGRGYLVVSLCKNNNKKSYAIHQLVGEYFVPNPDNKPYINHKKGIKIDNRATELEWCTQSENVLHGFRVLGRTIGEKHRRLASERMKTNNPNRPK